ncbi:MAG TPA: acyl-ACP--UDP-N-acetylglucosamine O-acyltransferase [Methylomirabilota bacterium]|jgi:UDP-N-acetylglucosamine acyltransferase|nr:acyl-ACP--UDP-N-acetylglucosamine O-acyltransferase [Methylomirabilota bacterium]
MIHPTAVIDPSSELAAGVSVAPYSIIGPGVRIGEGSEIGAHVVLEGRVSVGARCRIGHGALIGGVPQDFKYREGASVGVRIGDDTVIREYVTIHRATDEGEDTRVGAHCLVMASSHIAHDCVVGNHVIIINYAGLTGHVTVDDHATVGGLSGIRPFARIGAYAYLGGCSKVVQDVPPFVMADGNPATARAVNLVGMRRGGIDVAGRRQAKAAFRILYRSGLAPGSALARLKAELGDDPLVARMVAFIESSRIGIVKAGAADAHAEESAP